MFEDHKKTSTDRDARTLLGAAIAMLTTMAVIIMLATLVMRFDAVIPAEEGIAVARAAHAAVLINPDEDPMDVTLRRTNPLSVAWGSLLYRIHDNVTHPGLRDVLSDYAPDAAESIVSRRHCWVNLSAQAFDAPGSPLNILRQRAGNTSLIWAYLALHEQSHCSHGQGLAAAGFITMEISRSLAGGRLNPRITALLPGLYLESYADARAIILLANSLGIMDARNLTRYLMEWRNDPEARALYGTHFTAGTLNVVSSRIEDIREALAKAPVESRAILVHRMAAEAAELGIANYLQDSRLTPGEAAQVAQSLGRRMVGLMVAGG